MNKNEIKKAIYKQKPVASLVKIQSGMAYYNSTLNKNEENEKVIIFHIPVSDMGNTSFTTFMDAKLLNRWLVVAEE